MSFVRSLLNARFLHGAVVCAGLLGGMSAPVYAEEEPTVDAIQQAGEQFNLGRTAYKEEEYGVAADHFEQADRLAPNPRVLLLAIQSRAEAGQLARAATLAELAQAQYPNDSSFADTADLISKAKQEKARLKIRCDEPCTILLGMRLVHGPAMKKRTLYLDPGDYEIRAAFEDNQSERQSFAGFAGETSKLSFDAPKPEVTPEPAEAPVVEEPEPQSLSTFSTADPFADEPVDQLPSEESKGLSPAWFWTGTAVTTVLTGVSIWSAIDTQNNPGEKAIQEGCIQNDTSCSLYQDGLARQKRTNILWGVTAGSAVVTGLLAVFTDWNGKESHKEMGSSAGLDITPWVSVGNGAALGAVGRF